MDRGVDIPWVVGSIFHGYWGRYTIGRGSKFSKKNNNLKFKSFKKFENLKIKKNI